MASYVKVERVSGPAWGDVHVWWVALGPDAGADPRASSTVASVLAPDEIDRARSYRSPAARRSFVRHRAALRHILAHHLGSVAAEIRFGKEAHGRPTLVHPTLDGVRFSVSRSEALGVVVVARGVDVGVDVERRRVDLPFEALAGIALPVAERARLASSEDPAATFFGAWTRMEADLKLSGIGLIEALRWRGETGLEADGDVVDSVHVTLDAGPGYVATLAMHPDPSRVSIHRWTSFPGCSPHPVHHAPDQLPQRALRVV